MNILDTLLSKLFNPPAGNKQPFADVRQGQIKVLSDRLKKGRFFTPKVLTGTAMIAGLWWITDRREKVKEAKRERNIE